MITPHDLSQLELACQEQRRQTRCFWCECQREMDGEQPRSLRGFYLEDCEKHRDTRAQAQTVLGNPFLNARTRVEPHNLALAEHGCAAGVA